MSFFSRFLGRSTPVPMPRMVPIQPDPNKSQIKFGDSFINFLSGLGTGKDKSMYSQYQFIPVQRQELDAVYRSDWVARKIVDCPAQDATREWRKWMSEVGNVEVLEDLEADLQIPKKVRQALCWSRLYGGAALILGVDQGSPQQELDLEKIKQGDLKFIHVVSRYGIGVEKLNKDITSPYYNEPEFYTKTISASETLPNADYLRIHPSRVVAFRGLPLADDSLNNEGWGDSVLQVAMEAIKSSALVASSIATMVSEAKLDVIKVPDLSRSMSNQEYQDRLTARFQYANMAKSIINTIILDTTEEWNRIDTQFSALPEILRMFLLMTSGAADIPATRMLGQSPAGLSSTGESDTRNYYDRIASEQENELSPTLNRLDEVLIRSAFGSRDPQIYYEWNPLWQTSDLDKSTIYKNKAEAFKIDVEMGIVDEEALRIGRQNQVIEDGVYPGIDRALQQLDLLDLGSMKSPEERLAEAEAAAAAQAALAPPPAPGDTNALPQKTNGSQSPQ